jgi:hypothetical protein
MFLVTTTHRNQEGDMVYIAFMQGQGFGHVHRVVSGLTETEGRTKNCLVLAPGQQQPRQQFPRAGKFGSCCEPYFVTLAKAQGMC